MSSHVWSGRRSNENGRMVSRSTHRYCLQDFATYRLKTIKQLELCTEHVAGSHDDLHLAQDTRVAEVLKRP